MISIVHTMPVRSGYLKMGSPDAYESQEPTSSDLLADRCESIVSSEETNVGCRRDGAPQVVNL
jgi:hypothetical protein